MGKVEEEQSGSERAEVWEGNAGGPCGEIRGVVKVRCVMALFLGLAVLVSAVFWLPPFLRVGPWGRDRDPEQGADIVASFILHKPVAFLDAYAMELEYDIFAEIGVPNSLVVLLSLEPEPHSNWTNVVFGVWPYPKTSSIPSTMLSLIKSSFMSLVVQTSSLHLTTSLFGNSFFFQVLKFPGGITIIPPQSTFPLQKAQAFFTFTLNFPIYQVQQKFSQLVNQMKSGLLLNSYENLYIRLMNLKGSTVDPPTIVKATIVLAVGNLQPSIPRLKELAQTIRNSSAGNLGLNHTVFGRVKQIRLSSFLQRSLYSGGSDDTAPSPAPQLSLGSRRRHRHHHHHYHHYHHRHHHFDVHMAPAPAPQYNNHASAPTGCHIGIFSRSIRDHLVPVAAPMVPCHYRITDSVPSSAPVASAPHLSASQSHKVSSRPKPHLGPSSPLPAVYFARARPPTDSAEDVKPPNGMPSISLSPSSSYSVACHPYIHGVVVGLLLFVLTS